MTAFSIEDAGTIGHPSAESNEPQPELHILKKFNSKCIAYVSIKP